MRINIRNELLPLALLVIALIAAINFSPSTILRIILGLPFVLFCPGYALVSAFFPRREGVGAVERIALSFGLSIALISLLLLILNYTPWGIRLESILYSIASFILIMSAIAWLRRKGLAEEERFVVELHLELPRRGTGVQDKVLSIVLVLAILGAVGMMGYAIATPKVGQKFTEFYVVGLGGEATDYPKGLKVGETGRVTVGIINHEYETVNYRVELRINGAKNNELGPIVLEDDGTWRQEVTFVPQTAGEKQRVEFLLYREGNTSPYLEPLRLWIDVTE